MYGSTMFLVDVVRAARRDPVVWATQGVEPGTLTLAAGMATSGAVTDWLRELTGSPPWEELLAEVAGVPPGSRGLLLLPYFAGEQTPLYDPDARGAVVGLTLGHGRGELLRAAYEATAFGVRQILAALAAAGAAPGRAVAVGGGTAAELWLQVVSDVTRLEQEVPEQTIGASYGDALLAAIAAGLVPPETDWARTSRVVSPDRRTTPLYDELFGLYAELYRSTAGIAHALAAIQARG